MVLAFWTWEGWNALVAIGTLTLAGATIRLAVSTKQLAKQTADEINESRRVRALDGERRKIERLYEEVLRLLEAAEAQSGRSNFDVEAVSVAKQRVQSAIKLAGGAQKWPQTDLMSRDEQPAPDVVKQARGALVEIADAFEALG